MSPVYLYLGGVKLGIGGIAATASTPVVEIMPKIPYLVTQQRELPCQRLVANSYLLVEVKVELRHKPDDAGV